MGLHPVSFQSLAHSQCCDDDGPSFQVLMHFTSNLLNSCKTWATIYFLGLAFSKVECGVLFVSYQHLQTAHAALRAAQAPSQAVDTHLWLKQTVHWEAMHCMSCKPLFVLQVVNPPVDEADRIDRYDVDTELASLDLVASQPRLLQYRGYSTGYQFEGGERVLKGYMMTE